MMTAVETVLTTHSPAIAVDDDGHVRSFLQEQLDLMAQHRVLLVDRCQPLKLVAPISIGILEAVAKRLVLVTQPSRIGAVAAPTSEPPLGASCAAAARPSVVRRVARRAGGPAPCGSEFVALIERNSRHRLADASSEANFRSGCAGLPGSISCPPLRDARCRTGMARSAQRAIVACSGGRGSGTEG